VPVNFVGTCEKSQNFMAFNVRLSDLQRKFHVCLQKDGDAIRLYRRVFYQRDWIFTIINYEPTIGYLGLLYEL
jgi:hypothetical protein